MAQTQARLGILDHFSALASWGPTYVLGSDPIRAKITLARWNQIRV